MRKYKFTGEFKIDCFGRKVFRIEASISFGSVIAGDLGGWIEKESNLDQNGDAWVSGNAQVSGNAWVSGNARVSGNAQVFEDAWVSEDARVSGDAQVSGNARVSGDAWVSGDARVSGDAQVSGNARVFEDADYTAINGFGSCNRTTTFFRCKDGSIGVKCGCFYGTLTEFRKKVVETHGETKLAIEYLRIADLMEYHFSEED